MIKKSIFVVILIGFLAIVYVNGNAKDIPMKVIEDQLKEQTNIEEMSKCSDRDLMQFLGIDVEQYESCIYYKGTEALSVEELLIIKAYDKTDLTTAKEAVSNRVESQITTFEGYGPAQVAQLQNAIIKVKGNYLFYCVSKTPDKYEEVFKSAI